MPSSPPRDKGKEADEAAAMEVDDGDKKMPAPSSTTAAAEEEEGSRTSAASTAAAATPQNGGSGGGGEEGAAGAGDGANAGGASASSSRGGGGVGGGPNAEGLLLVGGKAGLYHCNYCMRDISSTIRIKCAVCQDWDLCMDCFAAGVELGKHKRDHPYRVVDNTHFPVFSPDWTATEELLMLSALEQHGMGNWGKVSELLNSRDKTEKACMEHYVDLYLHSYGSILPKETLLEGEAVPTESLLMEAQKEEYQQRPVSLAAYPEAHHLIDFPQEQPPDGTPYTRERFAKANAAAAAAKGAGGGGEKGEGLGGKEGGAGAAAAAAASLVAAGGESVVPGYMPLRGDFDVEHDNEAELLLADMEISPTEDPAEKQLKLMVIDVYNRKLDERERRKAFVRDYGLIDYKALQSKEKRKPKDERELLARLRVFARYQSPQEHERFVQGVLEAKRLRRRIEQLQQYRRLGIRTQAEAMAYEAEKRRREQEEQMRRQRDSASYLYDARPAGTGGKDRSSRYKKRQRDSSEEAGSGLLAGLEDDTQGSQSLGGGGGGGKGGNNLPSGVPGPLNIDDFPGAELLSGKEKELCAALRLLPKHYLYIKGRILRDAESMGLLSSTAPAPTPAPASSSEQGAGEGGASGAAAAATIVTMDVKKTKGVYDFLVRVGWVGRAVAKAAKPAPKDISITATNADGSKVAGGEEEGDADAPSKKKQKEEGGGGGDKEGGEEDDAAAMEVEAATTATAAAAAAAAAAGAEAEEGEGEGGGKSWAPSSRAASSFPGAGLRQPKSPASSARPASRASSSNSLLLGAGASVGEEEEKEGGE